MSSWVCKSDLFEVLAKLTEYLEIEKMAGMTRWVNHKAAIREAGRFARNAIIAGTSLERPPKNAIHATGA